MSNLVVILGPTGSGKSTSIKNLDPKETMILALESINKALPFK
jgi:predicted kinase